MATSDLVLRIVGQDQASPAFRQVASASKGLDAANKQVVASQSRTHRAFSATAKILTGLATGYAGLKIKQFLGESITAASDLNEAMTATEVVFKKQSNAVKAWSTNSATQFGQTRTQALSTARQFGTLFKSAGVGGKELSTYATGLTELASDIASFNNVPVQQAIDDMTSGLSGQVEPMRKYGVFLSANALKAEAMRMGIADGTKTLTDQQRTLASYNLILRQTGVTSDKFAKQHGDFQRTSAGFANQTRILAANWSSVKGAVGQAILPLATSVVTNLNQVLPQVTRSLTSGGLQEALEGMAPKVDRFFSSFTDNLPELKSIASDFGDAFGMIGRGLKGVFDTFNSLPDGVRQGIIVLGTAAATMKMLNRAAGGGGMTMFSQAVESIPHAIVRSGASVAAAESVKAVFGQRFGRMNIQAGVVNVNGGKINSGGPGGTAGKVAAPAGGALALIGGTAGGLLIAAGIVAAINSSLTRNFKTDTAEGTHNWIRNQVKPNNKAGSTGDSRGSGFSTSTTGGYKQPDPTKPGRWKQEAEGIRTARKETDSLGRSLYGVTKNYTDWKGAARSAKFEGVGGAVAVAGAIKKIPDKKSTRLETKGAEESKAKVKGLDGAIGGLKSKRVNVDERGAEASRGRVRNLDGSVKSLKGKTVRVEQAGADQARTAVDQLRSTIGLLQSKTIDIRTRYITEGGGPGKTANMATGGLIVGPGTATSDSIPAMLSNREFVQPAASVAYYGVGFMEALRTRRLPRPVGFAKGTPPTDAAKKRAKKIEEQVKQARKAAAWQARLAKAAARYDLGDGVLDLLGGMDKGVAKEFLPTGKPRSKAAKADRKQLKAMAAKNTAVTRLQERRASKRDAARDYRDAMREYDNWDEDREFSQMRPDLAIGRAQDKIAAAEKVTWSSKASDKEKAQAYRDRIEWTQKLEEAQQRLNEAQAQQLEKVNQLRDAVDSASGTYRSFASIATTSVTDVTDAQQKLTDANDAVGAAQKKMDLAGNDRERAAAANELAKALRDQQSAQQAVNTAGKPTSGSIRTNMAAKLQKLRDFSTAVKTLKSQGLNAVTLSELLQMGPEQGYDFAKALLDGGLGDINALQNQITTESASLGYFQYGTDTAAGAATGHAAAQAAGLVANGVVMAPAPVTVSIDGQAIAQALISYSRQNGGIPGWTS